MCLAVAGLIVAITSERPEPIGAAVSSSAPDSGGGDDLWRMAQVDFGGVQQRVSLACLPQARLGDQVLVHVGLAISLVEADAPYG
jgi:hydrogenase expression/formation protein HypC